MTTAFYSENLQSDGEGSKHGHLSDSSSGGLTVNICDILFPLPALRPEDEPRPRGSTSQTGTAGRCEAMQPVSLALLPAACRAASLTASTGLLPGAETLVLAPSPPKRYSVRR